MISACADILIERPAEPVFSFVVLDFFKNYQRWSPEVECLELLSPGPVGVGSTGRQVRVDQGRRTDTTFRIVTLEPLQCLEFLELGERYRIRYALEPVPLEADGVAAPAHTRLILSLDLKRLSLYHAALRDADPHRGAGGRRTHGGVHQGVGGVGSPREGVRVGPAATEITHGPVGSAVRTSSVAVGNLADRMTKAGGA